MNPRSTFSPNKNLTNPRPISTNLRRTLSPKKTRQLRGQTQQICGGLCLPKKFRRIRGQFRRPVFSELRSQLSDFGCSSRGSDFLDSTNPQRTFSPKKNLDDSAKDFFSPKKSRRLRKGLFLPKKISTNPQRTFSPQKNSTTPRRTVLPQKMFSTPPRTNSTTLSFLSSGPGFQISVAHFTGPIFWTHQIRKGLCPPKKSQRINCVRRGMQRVAVEKGCFA